ncbi:TPA: RHS repeat protein [Pseudomonas aeruginosa]|nr:RHS repeat protein [Pseudomonas aeruginosa]MBI8473882.1 RHS repeat protein [Pseudomonas aeruginosa]HEJ1109910.1 RHS repeat protein [Pseudomonas aeruginosa]HEJ5825047.1 RHS repeat protein [Pseudomonas aeruginosa]HEJ9941316.1 RHS repeat protein [Pseudomonas aeruginosa]
MVTLHREDGRALDFIRLYDRITSQADNLGRLEKIDGGWRYDEPSGLRLDFDEAGALVELVQASERLRLAREGGQVRVSHNRYPGTFSFAEDDRQQPLRLTAPGLAVLYNYEGGHLIRVARDAAGQASEQRYHYEDPRNPRLLTGITDNRGVRFATWRYDEKGRAVSSEHANGAEKVSLAYNVDGSTTVTNEYGKQATYRFQVIRGSKHIVAIEGQPSPNCPSSNSTFTYDDQGLLTSKRDNNGNLTTYQYNARGLETSRTEAAGTAQARTITTDWHPTLFLPVQVSEPGRITRYQYDAEGRKTGETVTTR